MGNSLDYLDFRSDLSFEISPFNCVDLFICSQLSTPSFIPLSINDNKFPLGFACDWYLKTHSHIKAETIGTLQSDSIFPMLQKLTDTIRFKDTFLCYPVNRVVSENTEQFAAITIDIKNGPLVISFRGTDDTIIGWKENFNMATSSMVPAQKDALDYLTSVADRFPERNIHVCGHSKGGNLAVFASAYSRPDIQDRILSVVSFDGPGFIREFTDCYGYNNIKNRITTVLSQNSIVGTLLNRVGTTKYVVSTVKGSFAHDGFTWAVKGTDFIVGDGLSDTSKAFEAAINETLSKMDFSQRQAFIEELFSTLQSTGASTITELANNSPKAYLEIILKLKNDKLVSKFVLNVVELMFKCYGRQ